MKMNNKGYGGFLLALSLIFLWIFFMMFMSFMEYRIDLKQCEKYNDYGFFIEINEGYFNWWGEGKVCLIEMEDGTKVGLDDYLWGNDLLKLKKPKEK